MFNSLSPRFEGASCISLLILAFALSFSSDSCCQSQEQKQQPAVKVRLNSLGYLSKQPKVATVSTGGSMFFIEDQATNAKSLNGQLRVATDPEGKQLDLWIADFTELSEEGRYRLVVPGVGRSCEFTISQQIYNRPFYIAMRAMYLWRCGCQVAGEWEGARYYHEACHTFDGYLDHSGGRPGHKDGTGGWHDAGDYNKYTVNGAFSAGLMLHTWLRYENRLKNLDLQLPNSKRSLPDFLEEVQWEIDWLLKMQAKDGKVYHKLSTLKFGDFMLPEDEAARRYFSPWGTAATADFVAIAAMASRVYRPYDEAYSNRCLKAAQHSYEVLVRHPEDRRPDQSAFKTGRYDSQDVDDRIWAAAELWEATGEQRYLEDLENRLQRIESNTSKKAAIVDTVWDWSNLQNLGVFTYLLSERDGRNPELVRKARAQLLKSADLILEIAHRHPYGRSLGDRYYWGCNGTVARQTINLDLAHSLSRDEKYRNGMLDALNYLFGRNHYGRSFVTGLGYKPPQHPHDRRSGADDNEAPWPGYLIGGAWPKPTDWIDDQEDYRSNEIAINWNASLIYALAAFVEPSSFADDGAK